MGLDVIGIVSAFSSWCFRESDKPIGKVMTQVGAAHDLLPGFDSLKCEQIRTCALM